MDQFKIDKEKTYNLLSLQLLCLKNVSSNLKLNYMICKKYNWKLPTAIAEYLLQKIYDKFYLYTNKTKIIDEDDLKIFEKDLTSFTRFQLIEILYKYPKFLLRIDKSQLSDIILSNHHYFLVGKAYEMEKKATKNLMKNTSNLLSFCSVTKIKFSLIFKYLLASKKTLRKLKFDFSENDAFDWNNLENFLEKCSKLEIIDLTANLISSFNIWNIQDKILNFQNTLKELSLCRIKCLYLNKKFLNSLLKFKNLEKIQFIDCSFLEKDKINDIFNSKDPVNVDDIDFWNFGNIKTSFSVITGIPINRVDISKFSDEHENIYFMDFLPLYTNLKIITFVGCLNPFISEFLAQLLIKCSNIRSVNLNENFDIGKFFKCICFGLEKSAKSLNFLSLSSCNLSDEECLILGELLSKCNNLKYLILYDNPIDSGFQYILNGLNSSFSTMRKLNLKYCDLSVRNIQILRNIERNYDFEIMY